MPLISVSVKHGKAVVQLEMESALTILNAMEEVEQQTGVSVRSQKLIQAGKVLDPELTLEQCKVKPGAKWMLMAAAQGQTQGQAAAAQVVQEKAAQARERMAAFRGGKQGSGAGPSPGPSSAAATMLDRARAWAATGIISLRDQQLQSVPEQLWQAQIAAKARAADLGGNRLETLPPEIGQLASLQRLRLSHNWLAEEGLPWEALAGLSQLATLVLDSNRLLSLPDAIGRLTGLQQLSVAGNSLTVLPSTIGSLRKLRLLDVSSNRLTALPEELAQCTSLTDINAQDNAIWHVPARFEELKELQRLNLDRNRVSTVPAVVLKGCVQLASFALHANPISAAQLRKMEGFAEYDARRRRKYDKQIDQHVMSSQGFDEGATSSDWQQWGTQ